MIGDINYVYFIRPVGMDGPIKIGFSNSPKTRLETLAAWSPFPLEIIGFVKGTYQDERFLHDCFFEQHSHREWFKFSPLLRDTIAKVIDAGSVDAARAELAPRASLKRPRAKRAAWIGVRTSYDMRVRNTRRRLEKAGRGAWLTPDDIVGIIDRWHGATGYGRPPVQPSVDEIARLDAYLCDPVANSSSSEPAQ
jgi:hypothetical protein